MRRQITRRQLMWGTAGATVCVAAVLGAGFALGEKAPRLFVFLPTLIRESALLKLLEAGLIGVEVTVFGRFTDFQSAVVSLRPEAALSLGDGLQAVGWQPRVHGLGLAGAKEPYVVLVDSPSINESNLAQTTLGVVDIVGRKALPALVQTLLSLGAPPRVRRVLKLSDLLPLLSLRLADGIVVPERLSPELKRGSGLPLRVIRPQFATLQCAAVAFQGGTMHPLIRQGIERLTEAAMDVLGVVRWEDSN